MSRSPIALRERFHADIAGFFRRDWGRGQVLMNDGACCIALEDALPGPPQARDSAATLDDQV